MSLSLHAVKDAALYGLNVAFVQQPKGAIARHAANLARVTYVVSALGYAAFSVNGAYQAYKSNAPIKQGNLQSLNKYNTEYNEWKSTGNTNNEPQLESNPLKPVYRPLFRNIGKALLGYGMYAGAGELRSKVVSFGSTVGALVAPKM